MGKLEGIFSGGGRKKLRGTVCEANNFIVGNITEAEVIDVDQEEREGHECFPGGHRNSRAAQIDFSIDCDRMKRYCWVPLTPVSLQLI